MNKIHFRKLRPSLHALLIGLCTGAFVSCGMEDDPGSCPVKTEQPVVIHIGAQQPPAVRAEEDAVSGENIHSLWVFLVDANNKVEWKLKVDDLNDVEDYYSKPIENLTTGAKTLYAFANFGAYLTKGDALYNETLANLLAIGEGDAFNADGIMIDNPAENIDFNTGKYVPMSGKAAVTVTENTAEIGVGMDRLVSKVRISLDASAGESGTVTFGGTSSSVSLMQGGTSGAAGGLTDRTVTFDSNTSGIKIPDFYVNATEVSTGSGFIVKLNGTDNNGNKVTYSATTQRKQLPRNSIYPLNLNFPVFGFILSADAWLAPIGEFVPVVDEEVNGKYSVELPQGCTYTFGFSGTGVRNLAVKWPTVADYGDYSITASADNSVSGALSAAAAVGSTFEIPFSVTFTAEVDGDESNYSRTYILEVTVRDIWDFPLWQPAQILPSETLDMYKN